MTIDELKDDFVVNMTLGVTQLHEVVVEHLDLEEIVKGTWKRNKALRKQEYFGEAFYRHISKLDYQFTEVHESFYEVLYNNQSFDRWKITNGRYAFREFLDDSRKEKTPFIVDFSSLSKIMKIYYESSASIIVPAGPLVKGFSYQLEDYQIIGSVFPWPASSFRFFEYLLNE